MGFNGKMVMNSQLFISNISKISKFSQGVLADSCFWIRNQQIVVDRGIGPHTWENPRPRDRKPVCVKAQVSASCPHLNTSKHLWYSSYRRCHFQEWSLFSQQEVWWQVLSIYFLLLPIWLLACNTFRSPFKAFLLFFHHPVWLGSAKSTQSFRCYHSSSLWVQT